jgi:hypothetical protein
MSVQVNVCCPNIYELCVQVNVGCPNICELSVQVNVDCPNICPSYPASYIWWRARIVIAMFYNVCKILSLLNVQQNMGLTVKNVAYVTL